MTKGELLSRNNRWLWRDAFRKRYGLDIPTDALRDRMLNTSGTHPEPFRVRLTREYEATVVGAREKLADAQD